MPLVALHAESGDRVNILTTSAGKVRRDYPKGSLLCPYCKTLMIPVGSYSRQEHFRHAAQCTHPDSKPESPEHLSAKQILFRNLTELYANYPDVEIKLEHYFPECGEHGRIADVAQIHISTGYTMAFEIQFSPLSIETLSQRHKDYENAGIEDIWFFGKKLWNENYTRWAIQTLPNGFVSLDFTSIEIEGANLFRERQKEDR